MAVADRVTPEGTLFSHKCAVDIFQDGLITRPSPDNPIPPMVSRHEELGRPLAGRYVADYTGAFWPHAKGVPVVDTDVLMETTQALS